MVAPEKRMESYEANIDRLQKLWGTHLHGLSPPRKKAKVSKPKFILNVRCLEFRTSLFSRTSS